jgi:hypothetical protein
MPSSTTRILDRAGVRLMSMLVTLVPVAAHAQTSRTAPSGGSLETTTADPATLDARVAQRFPDLNTAASRARLSSLRMDREAMGHVQRAVALLQQGRAIEGALAQAMAPLLAGRSDAEALDIIAAVMLHWYESQLKLGDGERALRALADGADAMAAAAVSPGSPTSLQAPPIRRR